VTASIPISALGFVTISMFRKRAGRPRSAIRRMGHGMIARKAR
jgi:hypothetical protein